MKSEIKGLERKVKKQTFEMQAYKKLQEEIFGKNGIPTEVLREILPHIEKESSRILSQISDGKFFTSLNFTKKDEIGIQAVNVSGGHPVSRYSGGERMRINLGLRLGISDVIAQRKGTMGKMETLIIDEGFGHLDAEGRRSVIDVINSLMDRFNKIFVISHVEGVKDTFETKLLVENVDGYSKIRFVN